MKMSAKKKKSTNFLNRTKTFTHAQLVVFVFFFALVGALLVLQSMAAPPSKTTYTGSLSLVMASETTELGVPNWNEKVKFNLSTNIDRPYVTLECSQNGTVVAKGTESYASGTLDDGVFGLYSSNWSSGSADCTAKLQYYIPKGKTNYVTVASTTFYVNP
jgi:hypothetical protein